MSIFTKIKNSFANYIKEVKLNYQWKAFKQLVANDYAQLSNWDIEIVASILWIKKAEFKYVKDYSIIATRNYNSIQYPLLISCIKNKNFNDLNALDDIPQPDVEATLSIISFKTEYGKEFIVTIYDGWDLYDNPEILEFFE